MKRKLTIVLTGGLLSVFMLSLALSVLVHFTTVKTYAAAGDGNAATYGIPLNADKTKPVFTAAQIKSAVWLDANQIIVTFANDLTATFFPANDADNGQGELKDQRLDSRNGDGIVTYISSDTGCSAHINADLDESKSAKDFIMTRISSANFDFDFKVASGGECVKDSGNPKITMGNPEMSVAYFKWVDKGMISSADGKLMGGTFSRAAEDSTIYTRDSEIGKSCFDKVVVAGTANSLGDTLKLYELDGDFNGDPPQDAQSDSCKYNDTVSAFPPSKTDIPIGGVVNKDKPAGTGDRSVIASQSIADKPSCESSGFSLSWIFCGIVNALAEATDKIHDNMLLPLLKNPRINLSDTDSGVYKSWSSFRNIANILMLFGLLFVVFGQTIGGGMLDAYTAKKMVPRIVLAAILVNLSYYLIAIANDITAVLGAGVASLIKAPFSLNGDFSFSFSGGTSGLGLAALFAAGAGIWLLGGGILSFLFAFILLPVFMAVLGAAFILILRRGILLLLTLIAPVAIALMVIPGGEKYTKKYRELLITTLLIYPLFEAIWAISQVLAVTINKANGNDSGQVTSIIGMVGTMIALFAPLFLIPFAFKLAGGIMSTIGAITNDRSKGLIDGRRKSYAERGAQNRHKLMAGERFQGQNRYSAGVNRTGARLGVGRQGRYGFGARGSSALANAETANADEFMKSKEFGQIKDNDPVLAALTYRNAAEARANLGKDFGMNAAQIDSAVAGAQAVGFGSHKAIAAARQMVNTGTGYNSYTRTNADGTTSEVTAVEQMAQTLARVSEGNVNIASGLAGYANYYAKGPGRYDQSPGFGNLNNLVLGAVAQGHDANHQVDRAAAAAATVAGSRAADPVTILRGKTPGVKNLAVALQQHLEENTRIMEDPSASFEEKNNAIMEVKRTIGQINQLDQSKSYASNENQMVVNELVVGTQSTVDHATEVLKNTGVGATDGNPIETKWVEQIVPDPVNPGVGKKVIVETQVQKPIGQEHLDDIKRFSAPQQQYNDPNNPQPPAAPPPGTP